jgi:hypothetical protein
MGILNQEPTLPNIIGGIDARLKGLEKSKRFNAPYLTSAPTFPANGDMWVRSDTGQVYAYVNNAAVQLVNTSGQITNTLGALGTSSGSVLTSLYAIATTSNGDVVDTRLIRGADGSDWQTAYWRIGRLVDVTRMGFIQFGDAIGTRSVSVGFGDTVFLTINALSATNQTNFLKLGVNAIDSESTVSGYTAYGALRTSCGYGIGISWLSNGGSSPGAFVPNVHAIFLAGGSTVSGDIRSSTSNTTSYNTSSDYRLKENVRQIDDAIERVRQLNPIRYEFKDPSNNMVYEGFLAHEVETVVPYAVSGVKDAVGENGQPMYQQIDTSWLIGLLTAAIKNIDTRLQALETP